MIYSQFFFTLFCMVAFCLGLNKIMEQGNLLYFLRKPFEGLYDEIERSESLIKLKTGNDWDLLKGRINILKLKYYFTKPLFTCITCFSSVWGSCVFILLNGIDANNAIYLIIACVSSAYIQTLIYVKANI